MKVNGEARIVHSDRQDCYDGNLPNRFSRDSPVGKIDNHNQIRDQSNGNCLSKAIIQQVAQLLMLSSTKRDKSKHNSHDDIYIDCDDLDRMRLSYVTEPRISLY